MRIGVVGVGRIGAFHAAAVRAHPAVREVVVRDIDEPRAAEVARALGASVAASLDDLLARVDGVVICTPTATHAELLEAVIPTRVPAFCEKPVALDLATTRRIIRLAVAHHATVQVGFQRRFDAGYRAARAAVRDGTLGRVYSVRIAGHDPAPPAEHYLPTSGGIFRDLHIHDFDIVPWVIGQPVVEVYAQGAVLVDDLFAGHGDVDTVAATLRFADGALGVLTGGRHDPLGYDIRLELFGSRDSIAVGMDARMPLRSVEPGMPGAPPRPYTGFLDRFDPAYRAELDAFIGVAGGRRENPCPVAEIEHALLVALACDRSRLEHRPVTIDEVAATDR
jgi:myo-inositol 2-dehydrogenase/D-chiro-inositol 1-dehydrogenase